MCVRLCLFSALSHRVGALQISLIILCLSAEPDFPYLEALAPYQPIMMRVCTGVLFHVCTLCHMCVCCVMCVLCCVICGCVVSYVCFIMYVLCLVCVIVW